MVHFFGPQVSQFSFDLLSLRFVLKDEDLGHEVGREV